MYSNNLINAMFHFTKLNIKLVEYIDIICYKY